MFPIHWGGVAALVSAVTTAHCAHLLTRSRDHWIAFVPDDAFYYLGLGRGFATTGRWSLDGGLSTSSGFHLIQGYISAACWSVFHELGHDAPVIALVSLSLCFTVSSIVFLSRELARVFGNSALAGPALVFLTPNALVCSASGMEWSLTVSALALVARIAATPEPAPVGLAVFTGCMAVLCRSDAVAWVAALVVAGTLALGREGFSSRLCLLGGAILGASIVAGHTHAITGEWIQDSALAKLHWGTLKGWDLVGALSLLSRTMPVRDVFVEVAPVAYLGLAISAAFVGRRSTPPARALLWGASATMLAAIVVDARNSDGLQSWYTSAVAGSVATALGGVCASVVSGRARHRRPAALVALVVVAALANLRSARRLPWPNQLAMLDAAQTLRDTESWEQTRIGAWNSGILAYYSGREVVNLDGLANHDALVASRDNRLLEYLCTVGIRHVVDFRAMLDRAELRRRGGYDARAVLASFREVSRAPPSAPLWLGSPLVYWKVSPQACAR